MTYILEYMAFVVSVKNLLLARAVAKASSWNGFGCARDVWPLQVLVRVWTGCAVACPGVRWHVKLRQEGATLMAFGALAANNWLTATLLRLAV
jgi:hypothetical protein